MAYFSSLVSLENTISQILDHSRYSISPHEKNLIISLDKYAISFQAFLEDFPEKAKKLEARIRDVAAEAEDIIEWVMTEQICPSIRYTKWIADLKRIKFEFQLTKVRDEMDSIAAEMAEIKNTSILVNDARLDHSLKPSSSSSLNADSGKMKMVGLNEDLIEIMDRLCRYSPQLQILPIFGMGGIGKTTLARNAYDDPLIVEYFDVRAWVTISQDYSERRILSDLFDATKELDPEWRNESMAAESCEQGNESLAEIPELSDGEMEEKVYKALIGRRFLIVMDDMWSTKALDYAKMFLPNGTNGSRIMLTTRITSVAAYANSAIPFHEMRLMDADQSWHLLRQKISPIPLELESTGKEIARSCGGLPLAIVVVAGLLSAASVTQTSWEEIARNVKSSLAATGDGQIEKILSLSYNHLPHRLRPCFLYMGGFPEDHEIKVTNLFRLWVAEGFVKAVASKSLEDSAQEYLEGLVERSLIVVVQRKSNGKIKSCSLHDLVREMCIKISKEEKFLMHITGRLKGKKAKGQRRISVSNSDLISFANSFSLNIRTIMYFQDTLASFGSLRLLRVLDVLKARFRSHLLPDQFFELFHLRYLAFCYDQQIPQAIANLQSLETLIIKASLYRPLPEEIWNMPQLRHLVISGCWLRIPDDDDDDAPSFLSLQNLQTLGKVMNLTCSLSILNMLPNLKKLRLTFFQESGDLLLHNLVHLSRLEKLQLELETNWTNSGNANHLVVPSSLKKLTLIGWGRYKPHLSVGPSFPNLQVLKLIDYGLKRLDWTTNGEFPQLKFLLLDGLDLAEWNILSRHFPRLEVLVIRACWRPFKLPDEIGEIPTLELIELKLCSKSMADSARDMQEEKRSYGDDAFQVRCIDCEDINELKQGDEFTQSLESVRKPIKRTRKQRLTLRQRNSMIMELREPPGYFSFLDHREAAELKIVDYKDAEIEL